MSFMDLDATSNKATGQKDLSPKGFAENGPATSLLLSHRCIADMLLHRASSAGHFGRNSNIQSFNGLLSFICRVDRLRKVRYSYGNDDHDFEQGSSCDSANRAGAAPASRG